MIIKLAQHVEQKLFQKDDQLFGKENILFHMKTKERLKDKFRYYTRIITTISPNDMVLLSLPPGLFFVYYLIRPLRMFSKYVLKR